MITITIEKCVVKVNSKKELYDVETVCSENNIGWCGNNSIHSDIFIKDIDDYMFITHHILIGNKTSYDGIYEDGALYNFKPFMEKYRKKKTVAKNEGDNIKSKIPDCYIKVTSKEEHEMVQKICFKHGVYWGSGAETIKDYYNSNKRGNVAYLSIDDNRMYNSSQSSAETNENVIYTFMQFYDKYNDSYYKSESLKYGKKEKTIKKKYRIKTEKELIEEFGEGYKTWESDVAWNHEGDMDYLFGKKLTDKQVNEILLSDYDCCIDKWSIDKKMIIEIKEDDSLFKSHSWMPSLIDPTQFMIKCERLFIKDQTKEQFKLNDSLYKKRKPNLKQDN